MNRYEGPIVDVDVHHRWKKDAEVLAYLPSEWKDYATNDPQDTFPVKPPFPSGNMMSDGARLVESFPEDGSPPGSDYKTTKLQLLDRSHIWRAVSLHDVGEYGGHLNPYYATALARAANDWNIDRWATIDDRLYTAVAINPAQPENAAAEVRRIGNHPKVVGVLLASNPLGRSYGDPLYDPIYKAAADMGLAIMIHTSAGTQPNSMFSYAGGKASSSIVFNSQSSQVVFQYISSFIAHGTFEKFPTLRVLLIEFGIAWLPFVTWRLDQNYELLRRESPLVKRWPSEYIRDHVRLATQPIEESPKPGGLAQLLQTVDGMDDLICYSSDYPHQTFDDPMYVVRLLPKGWERKVMCDNACQVFGWKPPVDQALQPPHARKQSTPV